MERPQPVLALIEIHAGLNPNGSVNVSHQCSWDLDVRYAATITACYITDHVRENAAADGKDRLIAAIDRRDDSHPRIASFRSFLVQFQHKTGRRRPEWKRAVPLGMGISDALVDAAGDIFVTAAAGGFHLPATASLVQKLRRRDGTRIWRQTFYERGAQGPSGYGNFVVVSMVLDSTGDLIVGGYRSNDWFDHRFAVAKLSGADGRE